MTAKQFLQSHCQCAENINVSQAMANLKEQMAMGLAGNGGSMPMIPTYLTNVDRSRIKVGEKRILIDAGGTNFRSALGYFDEQGKVVITNLRKTIMPASDKLLTKEQFYAQIAQNVSYLLQEGGNIGFCFSYQVDMDKDIDGTACTFSKEIKAPQVVGTRVGKETLLACKQFDEKQRDIVILNDTVATLLGGMASTDKAYSAYIGYIYGTGTNLCYVANTKDITKVDSLTAGDMLINTECGGFDGFAMGDFDKIAVSKTANPTKQLFEKMTSGKYLAEIIYQAFLGAQAEGHFVGATNICPFELKDVSAFLAGEGMQGTFSNEQDVAFAKEICQLLIDRAALLGAIVNSAFAIASCKNKALPVAIVAEGTTFNRLTGYRAAFEKYLTQILGEQGIAFEIVQGEELNLVGTLMATMAK